MAKQILQSIQLYIIWQCKNAVLINIIIAESWKDGKEASH